MRNSLHPRLTPSALTVQDFCEWFPMSRSRASELIRSGELPSFTFKGRRLIDFGIARRFAQKAKATGGAISHEVSVQKAAAGRKGRESQLAAAQVRKLDQ